MKKLILLLFSLFLLLSLNFVLAEENVTTTPACTDSDGGINYYTKGKITLNNENVNDACVYKLEETNAQHYAQVGNVLYNNLQSCSGDNCYVAEAVCSGEEQKWNSWDVFKCPNDCSDGACLKENTNQTQLEQITEKITCKFKNTNNEQSCYLAGNFNENDLGTKFCRASAGEGSCVISYSGSLGNQITWKSSCGSYQYTTQDGTDETIYFKCNEGETTITEINNNAFRFAYWQCYDGTESKSEDKTSCKPASLWKQYAQEFCKDKCTFVGNDKCKGNEKCEQKCGVNSFSVSEDCYSEEPIVISPIETSPVITEPELTCKDSCPLDGKCYQFGYRKAGQYCSDNLKFVNQLSSDEKCDNNFECSTNVCVDGKCVSSGLIQRILSWFKKLFGG